MPKSPERKKSEARSRAERSYWRRQNERIIRNIEALQHLATSGWFSSSDNASSFRKNYQGGGLSGDYQAVQALRRLERELRVLKLHFSKTRRSIAIRVYPLGEINTIEANAEWAAFIPKYKRLVSRVNREAEEFIKAREAEIII